MNPFYDQFKLMAGAGVSGDPDIGNVYRSVLYQRGFGYNMHEVDFRVRHGLGFADSLMSMFRMAMPYVKNGLQYLGKQAVNTAANIANDAIMGENFQRSAKKHVTDTAGQVFARAPKAIANSVMKSSGIKRKAVSQLVDLNQRTTRFKSKKGRRPKIGRGLLSTYPVLEKIN